MISEQSVRAAGVLLHPTSLPGRFGIGDIGPSARSFCDTLAEARQTYWQVLPLGPTGFGDSPYQSFSAFAGNTLLISPESLVEDGLLTRDDLRDGHPLVANCVDYGRVQAWKAPLLLNAVNRFRSAADGHTLSDLRSFVSQNAFWLEDYALFQAIRNTEGQRPWIEWPADLRSRDPIALRDARKRLNDDVEYEIICQYLFHRQWMTLKRYSNSLGIKIIGDIPIFVAYDSADVWCNREQFKLTDNGHPEVVAGVPPDFFSKTGQLWGNPIYDWEAMAADGFRWWAARVYSTLQMVDVARIDHFRGFVSSWEVPGSDDTAENGKWVTVPGRELFTELRRGLGPLPLIAEDLGAITPEVEQLRDELDFPGMLILQFAFGGDAGNRDLPHNYFRRTVAYTGTHDNDTSHGWFLSSPPDVRRHALRYLHSSPKDIHWDMVRAIWASIAETSIVPAQDLLGLGSEARMNRPASEAGNWQWRMSSDAWNDLVTKRLRDLTELYGRARP